MKQRLYVDMVGTLAVWKQAAKMEDLFQKGFFAELPPAENVIKAIKHIIAHHRDVVDVFILCAVLGDSRYAMKEQVEWLGRYLPEIPDQRRIFTSPDEPKSSFVNQLRPSDTLLDDYTANLSEWAEHGLAVKVINGVNGTEKTWRGARVDATDSPQSIANQILTEMAKVRDGGELGTKAAQAPLKNLYLIVGPSGAGKSTIVDDLCETYGYRIAQTYTDREPRCSSEPGHIFVTPREFDQLMSDKELCAFTEFAGHRYGMTAKMLDQSDLCVVDLKGVDYLRKHYSGHKRIVAIGLTVSEEIRIQRMTQRGDECSTVLERILFDQKEFKKMHDICDIVYYSGDLCLTAERLQEYITKMERNTLL